MGRCLPVAGILKAPQAAALRPNVTEHSYDGRVSWVSILIHNQPRQHFKWEETRLPGENPRLLAERWLTLLTWNGESEPRFEPTISEVKGTCMSTKAPYVYDRIKTLWDVVGPSCFTINWWVGIMAAAVIHPNDNNIRQSYRVNRPLWFLLIYNSLFILVLFRHSIFLHILRRFTFVDLRINTGFRIRFAQYSAISGKTTARKSMHAGTGCCIYSPVDMQ